jgi:hypothetical protein
VDESAGSVMAAIEHNESFSGARGDPGPELVEKMVLAALKQFDERMAGLGRSRSFRIRRDGSVDRCASRRATRR